MRKVISILAIVFFAFLAQAQAQEYPKAEAEAMAKTSGFYVGGGGGYSTITADVANLRFITGYRFNKNFAIEVGYINTYETIDKYIYNGFDGALVFRPDLPSGLNGFFISLGDHYYWGISNKRTSTIIGGYYTPTYIYTIYSPNRYSWGMMLATGYDFNLQPGLDFRVVGTFLGNSSGTGSTLNFGALLVKTF